MFNKRLLSGVALTALGMTLAPVALAQQTTADIRGEVMSTDGSPVANASVVIMHVPTGARISETTGSDGGFVAHGLRVGGPYTVSFSAAAYDPQNVENIYLSLDRPYDVTVDLEPAAADVVVTAERRVVRGERPNGSGTTLSRDDINNVVSVTRDFRDLARRDPLVTQNSGGSGGDLGVSIAGSNPRTNRITIDGVRAQDTYGLNTGGLPTKRGPISLDAVEQFSVQAVPFDVREGDFTGGALNMVLRSGTNNFHGSLFTNYLNEGLVGTRMANGVLSSTASTCAVNTCFVKPFITQDNYGLFFSGPVWQDHIFFALSFENYDSAQPQSTGPSDRGFGTPVPGLNQASITDFNARWDTYAASNRFDIGDFQAATPIHDQKYTGKLDWDINENNRLTITHRHAESVVSSRQRAGFSAGDFTSTWYTTDENDFSTFAQLNTHWSSAFSTELRASQRIYGRIQAPPNGTRFAEFQVCADPTSAGSTTACTPGTPTFYFGHDEFRQFANTLDTTARSISLTAFYDLGRHDFELGAQRQWMDVVNSFVPTSDGKYYFDSLADFSAGRANQLDYADAVSGASADAVARFKYWVNTAYLQDTWRATSDLSIAAGLRYDLYESNSKPALNPNFVARNGFDNQSTFDGRDVLMPRLSARWTPSENFSLSGGVGLFSGGAPDVWVGTIYSNTGILTNSVRIQRTASGGNTFSETTGAGGFNQTTGAQALNINLADPNVGFTLPGSVRGLLTAPTAAPVASLAPNFEIPSDWKMNLSARFNLGGWTLGVDAVETRVNNAVAIRDLRAQRLVINGVPQTLPDGRIRYDGLTSTQRAGAGVTSTNPGDNQDYQLYSNGDGEGHVFSVSLDRSFQNGFNLGFGYTRSNIDEFTTSTRFSSTISSLYGAQPFGVDPNTGVIGRSTEDIHDSFQASVGFSRHIFGDNMTRISLFGSHRTGRPYSVTMRDNVSGRSSVFGVARSNTSPLLFVPDTSSGVVATGNGNSPARVGAVFFDSTTTANQFMNAVSFFGLPQGIVPKNYNDNPDINQVDLQISQELPAFRQRDHLLLTFEIQNVLNLINSAWGSAQEYSSLNRIVDVKCVALNGAALTGTAQATCPAYQYSGFNTQAYDRTTNTEISRWAIQIGLKYEF